MKSYRQKQRQLPLPHMAEYFCQLPSIEWMWLLCICQDCHKNTSSSVNRKGLTEAISWLTVFEGARKSNFVIQSQDLLLFRLSTFFNTNDLMHCTLLDTQKARGQYQTTSLSAKVKVTTFTMNIAKRAESVFFLHHNSQIFGSACCFCPCLVARHPGKSHSDST